MRVLVFFDLPTTSQQARSDAAKFRNNLLKSGYSMLQFSVYARLCHSLEVAQRHKSNLQGFLPPSGQVRVMLVTEKQFTRMEFLVGQPTIQEKKHTSRQLLLF